MDIERIKVLSGSLCGHKQRRILAAQCDDCGVVFNELGQQIHLASTKVGDLIPLGVVKPFENAAPPTFAVGTDPVPRVRSETLRCPIPGHTMALSREVTVLGAPIITLSIADANCVQVAAAVAPLAHCQLNARSGLVIGTGMFLVDPADHGAILSLLVAAREELA